MNHHGPWIGKIQEKLNWSGESFIGVCSVIVTIMVGLSSEHLTQSSNMIQMISVGHISLINSTPQSSQD